MKCTCGLTHAVAVWACVSCVMLTATVLGHDAVFLSLLFQRPIFSIFTVVVPCVYVYVCVFALICRLTHWNHKSEVPKDSSQYGNDKKKGDLTIDTCSRVKGFETAVFTLN